MRRLRPLTAGPEHKMAPFRPWGPLDGANVTATRIGSLITGVAALRFAGGRRGRRR